MRIYKDGKLETAVCNCCGKILKSQQGYLKEECITIEHTFGYFSRKDTCIHKADLCEDCYDRIISSFAILPEETQENELL